MPWPPADIGGTPEQIIRLGVESPLHGQRGPQQIAAGRMLDSLGLAGRPGGIEDEQGVFRIHPLGFADFTLRGFKLMPPMVTAGSHIYLVAGTLIDNRCL